MIRYFLPKKHDTFKSFIYFFFNHEFGNATMRLFISFIMDITSHGFNELYISILNPLFVFFLDINVRTFEHWYWLHFFLKI